MRRYHRGAVASRRQIVSFQRREEIAAAVLSRDDVAKYLIGSGGESDADARGRVAGYLEELQTTQRYRFYRALQHPLYPILRKVERIYEHGERARAATAHGHVVWGRIKGLSHFEPLALDARASGRADRGGQPVRGGWSAPQHVTGAIIRRNSKDPHPHALRAYVAEGTERHRLDYA